MGRNTLDRSPELTIEELISLHEDIKNKTPFYKRKTREMLSHAIMDFQFWRDQAKENDKIFQEYYADG